MTLVDTPVWSLALRRKPENLNSTQTRLTKLLAQFVRENQAQLLGVVRQELLSGLREESEFRRLRDYLRDFPDVSVATEDYEEAAHSNNRCRAAGIATTTVDMLICAIAIRHSWEILSTDQDFVRYATVLKIRLTRL
jgi:predicted nucleic acid-binding protein